MKVQNLFESIDQSKQSTMQNNNRPQIPSWPFSYSPHQILSTLDPALLLATLN